MLAGFLARFGVIRLDNRLDQDDIRLGDRLLDMLGFAEIQAVAA